MLDAVIPTAVASGVPFKIIGSVRLLLALNRGDAGINQIGKFITLYPCDTTQLHLIVDQLDRTTRGLIGPEISTDRGIAGSRCLSYRYGTFGTEMIQTALGDVHSMIRAPDGDLEPDRRQAGDGTPSWAVDPLSEIRSSESRNPVTWPVVTVRTLYRSARTRVALVINVDTLAVAVAKVYSAAAEEVADGATLRMHRERAALIQAAACGVPVPKVLSSVDGTAVQPDAILLTDAEVGETLEELVARTFGRGGSLPIAETITIAVDLVGATERLHTAGVSHNDLKSANVLLCAGHVRLVDLDAAEYLGQHRRQPGVCTPGYAAPDRDRDITLALDDVHAIGALLYFLLTGAEPSRAPVPERLLDRPVRLLNPAVPQELADIVEACLTPARRPTLDSLSHALVRAGRALRCIERPIGCQTDEEIDDLVRASLAEICRAAERDINGCYWTSRHRLGKGRVLRDINVGVAGMLIAIADATAFLAESEDFAPLLTDAAAWLATSQPLPGPDRPGLYVGEMGVAIALVRAGLVLGDNGLTMLGAHRSLAAASGPLTSPDVFHGAAGRALGHLIAWQVTADDDHLRAARDAGDHLVATAERDGNTCWWPVPDGFDGLSGKSYLGYAHGAAGIADALLYLAEATHDERYLSTAKCALTWVLDHAVATDDNRIGWPAYPGTSTQPAMWCHGSAGIGAAILHAAALTGESLYWQLVPEIVHAVGMSTRWAQSSLCHGVAGSIRFLADASQYLDDVLAATHLADHVRILGAFRDACGGYITDAPRIITPDLMVGYGGVIVALCKAADPERDDLLRPFSSALAAARLRAPAFDLRQTLGESFVDFNEPQPVSSNLPPRWA